MLERLTRLAGELALAGDMAGVRTIDRVRAELLGPDSADRDPKPDNVIDLASRRGRS